MTNFENLDAKSVKEAVATLHKLRQQGKTALVVSGGSELLQLMKDRVELHQRG
jgi:CO/xanthine dehydrogenase FAD-binding subunit